ncbi:response regulator transcription factor [Cohnella soli]|uniref:Response regulator transcription factor n=1 Tax=Cohnella soli TaxID=425005 RepID=A0ABW0HXQ5_9BACL
MAHIAVVDDDLPILELMAQYLRKEGMQVTTFRHGVGLADWTRRNEPDLLVLDIMMPGVNGLALLTELRAFTEIPIVMVSAKGDEADRIIGLELGCSDFLAKPFNPRELVGRVRSLLRLVGAKQATDTVTDRSRAIEAGNVTLDPDYRRVLVESTELSLTSREFELFAFLLGRLDRPFGREQLVAQIWQYDFMGDVRVVDDLVKRLRKKLAEASSTISIETLWGFGYKATVKP